MKQETKIKIIGILLGIFTGITGALILRWYMERKEKRLQEELHNS